jgi:hypothetical protein
MTRPLTNTIISSTITNSITSRINIRTTIRINTSKITTKATPSLHSSKMTSTISMGLRNNCKQNRPLTSSRLLVNRVSKPINNPRRHIHSLRNRIHNRATVLRINHSSTSRRVTSKVILISKTLTRNRQKQIRTKTNS